MRHLRLLFATVLLTTGSCTHDDVTDAGFDIYAEGPFGAGYRELATQYTLPDGRGTRTIKVSVWYPIDRAWYDDPTSEGCAQYLILTGSGCGAVQNAPPAPPAYRGGYPVVVHSHGHSGWSSQSKYLGEHLSRHGYVVIAPNHEGNTILDATNTPDYVAVRYERQLDVSAALDLLESGLPPADPLAGRAVTDRVVMTGHSRGGVTVWSVLGAPMSRAVVEAACAGGVYDAAGGCPAVQLDQIDASYRDPRVVAGMLLATDGSYDDFGGPSAIAALPQPTMILVATGDGANQGVRNLDQALTDKPLAWVEFTGACHNFFAHDPHDPTSTTDPCSLNIDHPAGQAAFRTYLLAFARSALFGDASATVTGVLDGTAVVSSVAIYHP